MNEDYIEKVQQEIEQFRLDEQFKQVAAIFSFLLVAIAALLPFFAGSEDPMNPSWHYLLIYGFLIFLIALAAFDLEDADLESLPVSFYVFLYFMAWTTFLVEIKFSFG